MLKLIGASLILISTTLAGFYLAHKLSTRTKQIREWIMNLQLLETEISYGSTPLESAFQKLGQHRSAIGDVFKRCTYYLHYLDGATTYECWQSAIHDVKPKLVLKEPELEWLHHFGKIIGTSDALDQQKHLRLMIARLKKVEDEAHAEQNKYEKMYKTLGFLSGALIVIIVM